MNIYHWWLILSWVHFEVNRAPLLYFCSLCISPTIPLIQRMFTFWDHAMYITEMKGAQSCLTLCDPMDYTVHGILQARILEWVAFPFSRGSSQPRNQTRVSCIASGFFTNWAIREAQLVSTTKSEVFQVSINQQVFTAAAAVTSVVSDSVRPRRRQPTRLLCPWDSPGKNTGVGCHFLLRNIYWIPIKTLRLKSKGGKVFAYKSFIFCWERQTSR